MLKYLFIILALLTIQSFCQSSSSASASLIAELDFQVNVTSSTSELRQRLVNAKQFTRNLVNGALIKSFEIVQLAEETTKDAIRFAAYAINPVLGLGGVAPTISAAFYPREVDVSNLLNDRNGFDFDVSASTNFMSVRFYALEEINVAGSVVNTIKFNTISWSVIASNVANVEAQLELPQFTLGGSSNGISIQISVVSTANLGTISISNLAQSLLSPKGVEVVFAADLSAYQYANPDNTLRLVLYSATGAASLQTNVVNVIPALNGDLISFVKSTKNGITANIRLNQEISIIGGANVNINPSLSLDTSLNSIFNGIDTIVQINAALGANVQLTRVNVPFTAGLKSKIAFDTALTFGVDPSTQSSKKESVDASLIAELDFQVNVTSSTSELRQRLVNAKQFTRNLVNGALIKSFEIVQLAEETTKDAIRFAAYAINPVLGLGGVAPTISAAFYPREVDVSNLLNDRNGFDFDVSASTNFMSVRFYALEEINVAGSVVNTIKFNTISWSVIASNVANVEAQLELPQFTLGGSSNGISIQISVVSTANLGTISISNLAQSLLSPKGVEVVFAADLSAYQYANPDNTLRLVLYSATGAASLQTNVVNVIPALNGDLISFVKSTKNGITANIRLNQEISIIGGANVNISPSLSLDTSLNSIFNGIDTIVQINAALGANVQLTRVNVPFTAGLKSKIAFDTALTFGVDPSTQSRKVSASTPLFVVSSLLFFVLLILNL